MRSVRRQLHVPASPEAVWAVIRDFDSYETLYVGATRFDPIVSDDGGERYEVRLRVGSSAVGGSILVTVDDAPKVLAWVSDSGVAQEGRWILTPAEGGTDVVVEFGYQLVGGLGSRLVERLAATIISRQLWATLHQVRHRARFGMGTGAQA